MKKKQIMSVQVSTICKKKWHCHYYNFNYVEDRKAADNGIKQEIRISNFPERYRSIRLTVVFTEHATYPLL